MHNTYARTRFTVSALKQLNKNKKKTIFSFKILCIFKDIKTKKN